MLRFGVPFEDQGGPFFDPNSPKASANPTPRLWLDLIYGTMIIQTEDGKGAPGLATEWSAPDANTVELTLRDGVKFSDGTDVRRRRGGHGVDGADQRRPPEPVGRRPGVHRASRRSPTTRCG